jgi:hypothetical protein
MFRYTLQFRDYIRLKLICYICVRPRVARALPHTFCPRGTSSVQGTCERSRQTASRIAGVSRTRNRSLSGPGSASPPES